MILPTAAPVVLSHRIRFREFSPRYVVISRGRRRPVVLGIGRPAGRDRSIHGALPVCRPLFF